MSMISNEDYATLKPVSGGGAGKPEAVLPSRAGTDPVVRESLSAPPEQGEKDARSELGMLSHYKILRLLGQGGMGKVYQAEDTRLERVVALKVMLPELSDQASARARFLREARTMAAVRDDNVVTIYEVDQVDEVPFLAMEFLKGQSLEEWLSAGQPPRVGDILRIGREIASGLAAAQARGLIHRDIKPANIWLEAPTGRVKILDFGLARPATTGSGLTHTGAILGTPYYMAPEQARGDQVDGRADLFSLGVLLYQLCTQQLPFRGNSITAVLTALAVDQPAPIRGSNPNIPQPLADLVHQLLEKDPARRPQSATDLIVALQTIEGQLPNAASSFLQRSGSGTLAKAPTVGPNAFSNTVTDPPRGPALSPPAANRRRLRLAAGAAASFLFAAGICWWAFTPTAAEKEDSSRSTVTLPTGPPIKLGVLYSRTGTMAISERPILDGILLAVAEINEKGGVLGRPVEAVIEDGLSDETVFARKAVKLIQKDEVCSLIGCWTSASRKAVKAVVEKHDHLLFYPVSHEGMELSPNVVYGGSVPNQQILPALRWSYGFLNKKRWFLVGSDSIFSNAANAVIRDEAQSLGSQIVGEEYLLPGSTEVAELVRRIARAKPDLIVNTILGDTNVAFFRALRRAGITPAQAPTLSFAISEEELSSLAPEEYRGHYAAGNYFQTVDLPRNQEFLRRVKRRFDSDRIVSDPMQTGYTMVHLWAQALKAAGRPDVRAIRKAIPGQQYDSPQGRVTIDPATLHMVQVSRVGRIDDRGRFIEVYVSPQPIPPEPFPASRSPQAWEQLLQDFHRRWGGRWHNPG